VSPPWVLGKCTCRNAAAKSPETAIGALTNPGAVAVAKPRGAYAPRSCVAVRMSAGEKRFLRCTNAGSTKSGGRQPAVGVKEMHLQERCRQVAGDCHRCAHKPRCSRGSETTGGLRPPLLVARCWFADEKAIFAIRERSFTRAAGVSPPWFDNTMGTAADFFGLNTFLHRTFGSPHHGGLTPPALGCTVLVRR
jgi:hypothetical protein